MRLVSADHMLNRITKRTTNKVVGRLMKSISNRAKNGHSYIELPAMHQYDGYIWESKYEHREQRQAAIDVLRQYGYQVIERGSKVNISWESAKRRMY